MSSVAEPHMIGKRGLSLGGRAITALLTNPVAMAIKRPLRDLVWALKGVGLKNPPLPTKVESVLFVCLGNICRSPFAAELAAERLRREGGVHVRCTSAGIRTTQAARSPKAACDVAATYGLSLVGHRPQTVTRELMASHGLIVVMEAAHLLELRTTYPDVAERVVLLSLFDREAMPGYDRYNIADPFSRPRAAFEACYERIDRALSSMLSSLDAIRENRSS